MGAEHNGLTLEQLAQSLEALQRENAQRLETQAQRLEALERENEWMRSENAELRIEVAALKGSGMHQGVQPASAESGTFEGEGRVSRRQLLSKVGAAAAGLVVAGALTQTDIREAKAAQVIGDSAQEFRGGVEGTNTNSFGYGVMGRAPNAWGVDGQGGKAGVRGHSTGGYGVEGSSASSDSAGVYGENSSTGPSVKGVNLNRGIGVLGVGRGNGGIGVQGESSTVGYPAIVGKHSSAGFEAIGVLGDTVDGVGVKGLGKTGVIGQSPTGEHASVYGQHVGISGYGVVGDGKGSGAGVLGRNSSGYGGQFEGGKAQLMLEPADTRGKPTGTHAKGEIYMDSAGTLFVCTAAGTPGKWRKVSTTIV